MPFSIRSLDNYDVELVESRENMAQRDVAAKLKKFGSLATPRIHRNDLISISQWLTFFHKDPWEVGLVQDRLTGNLRLLNGEASRSFRIGAMVGETYLRPNDVFIVHVHPVMASKPGDVDADRKNAGTAIEGFLDWSGKLLCYTRSKLYNEPDRRSPVTALKDAADSVKRGHIPFIDSRGVITGYAHFDDQTREPTFVNPFEIVD
jgi:hypothetical protein